MSLGAEIVMAVVGLWALSLRGMLMSYAGEMAEKMGHAIQRIMIRGYQLYMYRRNNTSTTPRSIYPVRNNTHVQTLFNYVLLCRMKSSAGEVSRSGGHGDAFRSSRNDRCNASCYFGVLREASYRSAHRLFRL